MKAGSSLVPALPGGQVLPKPLAESCKKCLERSGYPVMASSVAFAALSWCCLTKAQCGKLLTVSGNQTNLELLRVLLLFWQRWRDYT